MPSHARFALVTGSSRGIGRAIALALAERGSNVAVHYHTRQDAAEEVLAEVRARGADGFTVSADVTKEDDLGAWSSACARSSARWTCSSATPARSWPHSASHRSR
jgi:NAD(P)-dependent dehydrogenase (short-subunit alcohol dehydrogenase family)